MATTDHARHALIAVVDDDQGMLGSLALLLGAAGYEVRLFSSGAALLESGELRLIDCLISDLGMPDMDGFELGREAQATRPDLPVVFVTGRPELLARSAVDGFGPHRSFTKPFNSGELLAAIAELLRGPHEHAPRG
jgi:DNA-binding response OmpR family regulator